MRINWKAGGLGLFLGTWFVYSICPPFTSYDSYWTVPTTLNILAHGTTNVDQYQAAVPAVGRYDLECVPASGRPTSDPGPGGCRNGHWYNWFPVAVSFFALPLIVLFKALVAVVGPWVRHAGSVFSLPPIAAFFAGDFVKGHSLAELWCASTFGAITVWSSNIASRSSFFPRARPSGWRCCSRSVTADEQAFIAAHRNELPELETIDEERRLYPRDGFAAHLIGYVGEVSEDDLNNPRFAYYEPGDVVGKAGVEETYDELLRGQDGSREVVVDSRGREVGYFGIQHAVPGQDLRLTIDNDLQRAAELAQQYR